jgi:Uma2 family endonuclease
MSQPALRMPTLPTEDDLPCDDGEPMETLRHRLQMELLIRSLEPWAKARGDVFLGGNMFLYFSADQLRGKDFRGPDFFAVLGVSPRERKSWVVWDEEKGPDLIVELLSDSTRQIDKVEKKRIYQDRLRVAEYFWFDPWDPDDLAGFTLTDGHYRPIEPAVDGRLPSPLLGLALAYWDGVYGGVEARWVRWASPEGAMLPTDTEAAQAEAVAAKAHAHAAQAEAAAAEAKAAEAQSARDAARQAVEAEMHRAQAAERRAQEAEAEVARLRAQLGGG